MNNKSTSIFLLVFFLVPAASHAVDFKKYLDISGLGARTSASDVVRMCDCANEFEVEAGVIAPLIEKIYLPIRLKIMKLENEKTAILAAAPELAELAKKASEGPSPYQSLLSQKHNMEERRQYLMKFDEFLNLLASSSSFPKGEQGKGLLTCFGTADAVEKNFESSVIAYFAFYRTMSSDEAKIILTKLLELGGLRVQAAATLNPFFAKLPAAFDAFAQGRMSELDDLSKELKKVLAEIHDRQEELEVQISDLSEQGATKKTDANMAAFESETKLDFLRSYDQVHAQLTAQEGIFRQALKIRSNRLSADIGKKFGMPGASGPYGRVGFDEPFNALMNGLDSKAQKMLSQ